MEHHITLVHWGKEYDHVLLPRLDRIRMRRCKVLLTGTSVMRAAEGSFLLFFAIAPSEGFNELLKEVCLTTGMKAPSFLHMTIAVDKDFSKIQ